MKKLSILAIVGLIVVFAVAGPANARYINYDIRVPANVDVSGGAQVMPTFNHQSWQGDIGGNLDAIGVADYSASGYGLAFGGANADSVLRGYSFQLGQRFAFALNIGCVTADASAYGFLGTADVYAAGSVAQNQGGTIGGYHGYASAGNSSIATFEGSDYDTANSVWRVGRCFAYPVYIDLDGDAETGGIAKTAGLTVLNRDLGYDRRLGAFATNTALTAAGGMAIGDNFAETMGQGGVGTYALMGPSEAGGSANFQFRSVAPYGGVAIGGGVAYNQSTATFKQMPNGVRATASNTGFAASSGGYSAN